MQFSLLTVVLLVAWVSLFSLILYLVRRWLITRPGPAVPTSPVPKRQQHKPSMPPRKELTATALRQMTNLRSNLGRRWTRVILGLGYHAAEEPDRYIALIQKWLKDG